MSKTRRGWNAALEWAARLIETDGEGGAQPSSHAALAMTFRAKKGNVDLELVGREVATDVYSEACEHHMAIGCIACGDPQGQTIHGHTQMSEEVSGKHSFDPKAHRKLRLRARRVQLVVEGHENFAMLEVTLPGGTIAIMDDMAVETLARFLELPLQIDGGPVL